MDDDQLVRTLATMQVSSMDATASMRALEKIVLALVALHQDRKALIELTDYFLRSDALLRQSAPEAKPFLSSYRKHGERLLSEMRDIQANL